MDHDLALTSEQSPRTLARRRNWLSYRLRSLVIVVTIFAAILAASARQIREHWIGSTEPYATIQTADELRAVMKAKRAVIFVHVDWSIDCMHARNVFRDFAVEWRQRMPKTPVDFYLLDLTEQYNGLDELGVEAVEVVGFSHTKGSGEIFWIGDSKPRTYREHAAKLTHAELANISQQAFQLSSVAHFPGNPPPVPEPSGLWYWDDPDSPPEPFAPPVNDVAGDMNP
jgi:hypothetical protein